MALNREDIEKAIQSSEPILLRTGFTYRKREEVPDFELAPETLEYIAKRFKDFDEMQFKPGRDQTLGKTALYGPGY